MMRDEGAGLPIGEYGPGPGPLRERLVAAILSGEKTATSSLAEEWLAEGEPLPAVGDLERVIDSEARPVCSTRNTRVDIVRLCEVSLEHALAEGEGFASVAEWREAHERFWWSDQPSPKVDDTLIVCVQLEVIERFAPTSNAANR